ncbi:hypothetical protein CFP56_044137 [Quercus suber]|uniref:Reverse transcriptase zinc-binding domain-containing protein n=1 Tax=Quercus suber TaxID=58331 RepID=A0AAW0IPJ2_QUESU
MGGAKGGSFFLGFVNYQARLEGCLGARAQTGSNAIMEGWLDALPSRANLKKRKIISDDICPNCKLDGETSLHALWSCSALSQCCQSTVTAPTFLPALYHKYDS